MANPKIKAGGYCTCEAMINEKTGGILYAVDPNNNNQLVHIRTFHDPACGKIFPPKYKDFPNDIKYKTFSICYGELYKHIKGVKTNTHNRSLQWAAVVGDLNQLLSELSQTYQGWATQPKNARRDTYKILATLTTTRACKPTFSKKAILKALQHLATIPKNQLNDTLTVVFPATSVSNATLLPLKTVYPILKEHYTKLYQLPPEIVDGIKKHGSDFLTLITEIVKLPNRTISAAKISLFLNKELIRCNTPARIQKLIGIVNSIPNFQLRSTSDMSAFEQIIKNE